MRYLMLALVLSMGLAGCSDGAAPPAHEEDPFSDLPQDDVADGKGRIRGIVVDPALVPVAGASIRLMGPETTSTASEAGAFVFDDVEPGTYFIEVSKIGYSKVQQGVEVQAGVDKPGIVKVMIERVPGSEPRADTFTAEGFIACGVGTPATFHVCPGLNEDKSTVYLPYGGMPQWIQVETTWDSTQAAGEQLYLVYYWCELDTTCTARPFGDRWYEGNSDNPTIARTQNDRADMQMAVYASPGGPANGTGVALDQAFYSYMTFFYNIDEPDEDWSFLSDGAYPVPQ